MKYELGLYEKQAEDILRLFVTGSAEFVNLIRQYHFRTNDLTDAAIIQTLGDIIHRLGFNPSNLTLGDAREVTARLLRYHSWEELAIEIEHLNSLDQKRLILELAKGLRDLAERERGLPDASLALVHYEEAVSLMQSLDEPLLLAHTVRHLGDLHYDNGQMPEAEVCFQQSLILYHNHERIPTLNFANAIRSLAVLKDNHGNISESVVLWREAHGMYKSFNIQTGVAESAAHLAMIAQKQGNRAESMQWLDDAISAAEESGDEESIRFINWVKDMIVN